MSHVSMLSAKDYHGFFAFAAKLPAFGISAPGNTVMKELGMTKEHVVAATKAL